MKFPLTILFIAFSIYTLAQGTQATGTALVNLDVTNINPTILTGGDMFHDLKANNTSIGPSYYPGFEVPRGSGKHSLSAAALWIGGKDQNNNLYVAAQTYRMGNPKQTGFWPGPVATNHNAAHSAKYDKIWKVSKAQIQDHVSNYFRPGYITPAEISSWPGNGNTANGEAAKLAPYVDLNKNGIYEPDKGEYPEILGDQALYLILNEQGNHKEPFSPIMNTEIHVMYFGFDNPSDTAVYNTLFCQYRIINRGKINYNNFYAGIWADFELGFFNDDYVGCDTLNNSFYVYNGDDYDQGANGYGLHPPVQSICFLDQKMSHFMYYNNSNNPVNGDPHYAADFYNYLRGHWKNNMPLTYGGFGVDPQKPVCQYMFPGNPDTGQGWSEVNTLIPYSPFVPTDRRGVGSIGPFNLPAGQELKFTVAYTFSRPNPGPKWILCDFFRPNVQAVQTFFNNKLTNPPKPIQEKALLELYPNPATNQLFINLPASFIRKDIRVQIIDITGRELLSTNSSQTGPTIYQDISFLCAGIYQVVVTSSGQLSSARLVKL